MRKRKRLFAMILVLAIALTTVLSTVAAFATDITAQAAVTTETDDTGNETDIPGGGNTSVTGGSATATGDPVIPATDYSKIAAAKSTVTVKAPKKADGYIGKGKVGLKGVPENGKLKTSDIKSVRNTGKKVDISSVKLVNTDGSYKLQFQTEGLGSTKVSMKIHGTAVSFTVVVKSKYNYGKIRPARSSYVLYRTGQSAQLKVPLKGIGTGMHVSYLTLDKIKSSNKKMSVDLYRSGKKLRISIYGEGLTTVSYRMEGTTHKIRIRLTQVYMRGSNCNRLQYGKWLALSVRGASRDVKWKSLNPSIASVSSTGKVHAIGLGCAIIRASVTGTDGKTVNVGTAVNCATASKLRAFNWAHSYAAKNTYSQPKRMKTGYYDCSSLVWRAYRTTGYTMVMKNWAPTAADLAKNLLKNHHGVGYANNYNYSIRKFRVGDLYFETGARNGRFKGIYHVEMFGGFAFAGFDSKGRPILEKTYANRTNDYYFTDPTAFFCRP